MEAAAAYRADETALLFLSCRALMAGPMGRRPAICPGIPLCTPSAPLCAHASVWVFLFSYLSFFLETSFSCSPPK